MIFTCPRIYQTVKRPHSIPNPVHLPASIFVRKLEHRSHFSLFLLTMDALLPLSLTAFPFAYCLIDFILPSPLCSLRPVLQCRPTHRPQTHTDLTISPFPSVRDG